MRFEKEGRGLLREHISDKQTSDLHVSILFLTPLRLQTSDFERSDQYCHYKTDNYIIIPRMPMHEDEQGVLLASALHVGVTLPDDFLQKNNCILLNLLSSLEKGAHKNPHKHLALM